MHRAANAFAWATLLLSRITVAATVDTGTQDLVCFGSYTGSDCPVDYFHTSSFSGAEATFAGSVTGTNPGETSSYQIMTSATFGSLHAYASQSASGNASSGAGLIAAYAWFNDLFTFTSPGETGSGTAYFMYNLDGSGTVSPGTTQNGPFGDAFAQYYFGSYPASTYQCCVTVSNSGFNSIVTSNAIPFIFGAAVNIDSTLVAAGNASCQPRSLPVCSAWNSGTITDFSETAILVGIELFDSSSNAVSNFSVQSGSGTVYTADGVVPEPATVFSATLAVILLILRRECLSRVWASKEVLGSAGSTACATARAIQSAHELDAGSPCVPGAGNAHTASTRIQTRWPSIFDSV